MALGIIQRTRWPPARRTDRRRCRSRWVGSIGEPDRAAAGPERTRSGPTPSTPRLAGRDSGGGSDYGRNVRPAHAASAQFVPEVVPGTVKVHGSLDKEIIRRIVHQHMNEVKFCYDQELARKPTLAGRISVQFAISPVGQVSRQSCRAPAWTTRASRTVWSMPSDAGNSPSQQAGESPSFSIHSASLRRRAS